MHETGCSWLVHWDDPERWDGPNVRSLFSSECGSFRRVKITNGDRTRGVRKDNMGPPVVRFFRKTEQRFKRLRVFGIRA